MSATRTRGLAAAVAIATAVFALAACGKPGYCSDKSKLQKDIQGLSNQLQNGNVKSVSSSLQKIDSDAQKVISSAKSDFPSQADAMGKSVQALKTNVKNLGSPPTPEQLVTVIRQSESVVSAVNAFDNASSSKCS